MYNLIRSIAGDIMNDEKLRENDTIDFDAISGWISKKLKTPNDIVRCENRTVIVNVAKGIKQIEIPKIADGKAEWRNAWLKVYELCLDALQLKVNHIYNVGKREGIIAQNGVDEVRVGTTIIRIPEDYNSVGYARALEKIIGAYNMTKAEQEKLKNASPISVNHTSVKIDNPQELMTQKYKSVPASDARVPKISVASEQAMQPKEIVKKDDNRVKAVRLKLKRHDEPVPDIVPSEVIQDQMIIHKIPANVSIDNDDCGIYRNQPLIIASCASVKHGDGIFRDNIDVLRENIPDTAIGSFISGKSVNIEQAIKEAMRMIKLLNSCDVTKCVIYELNNDYINDNLQNKDAINEIVTAALKICDILKDSEFYPILCMDIDTYEHIKEQIEAINNYPILKCVTPKQKALAKEEDDIIYMNPSSDTDIITIFNRELQTNLVDIPKKQIRESRMRQAA